jgi:hypothetical protein
LNRSFHMNGHFVRHAIPPFSIANADHTGSA